MGQNNKFDSGDLIVKDGTEKRWVVIGWTPGGKLRMLPEHAKKELTAWWEYPSQLPEGYRVIPR